MTDAYVTTGEAAKLSGKAQRTILNYIGNGKLTATKDDLGNNRIDKAELARVFPNIDFSRMANTIDHQMEIKVSSSEAVLKQETELLKTKLLAEQEKNSSLAKQLEREAKRFDDFQSYAKQSMNLLLDQSEKKQRKRIFGIF